MDFPEYFKVFQSQSLVELKREVNGHLRNGWRLHGPFFQDPFTREFFQAVERPLVEEHAKEHKQLAA